MPNAEPLLKPRQVAEMLGYDVRTIQRMCKAREIPCLFVHGQYRFRSGSITRWLEQQERGPESAPVYGIKGGLKRAAR